MTIEQAIAKVDALKPNQYDNEMKVDWLSYLDGIIFETSIKTHERGNEGYPESFMPYTSDNMTTELLVKFPYDELYPAYLSMKIDEANNETTRYNNSAAMFNGLMEDFKAAYNRDHMPINGFRFRYRER